MKIRLLLILMLAYSYDASACDYSLSNNGNESQTVFSDGGDFFLCGGKNSEHKTYFEIISPLAGETSTVIIPQSQDENNFRILQVDSNASLAILQTWMHTPQTTSNPVGNMVSRFFLLNLINAKLTNVTPELADTCEVIAPKFALDASAMIYSIKGAVRSYNADKRQWTISGCNTNKGLYIRDFADIEHKKIMGESTYHIMSISPSGKTISLLKEEDSSTDELPTLITKLGDKITTQNLESIFQNKFSSIKGSRPITRGFISDDELIGIYFKNDAEGTQQSALFKLTLSTQNLVNLDTVPFEKSQYQIQVINISEDKKHVAYRHISPNGIEIRAVSIAGGSPLVIGKTQTSNVLWAENTVIVEQENGFQYTNLLNGESYSIMLNPDELQLVNEQRINRNNRRIFTLEDSNYANIVFPSIKVFSDQLVFLINTSSHFCNTQIFSIMIGSGDIRLLSPDVKPETCGAIHLSTAEDNKSVIYLNDYRAREKPTFFRVSIDDPTDKTLLYKIE